MPLLVRNRLDGQRSTIKHDIRDDPVKLQKLDLADKVLNVSCVYPSVSQGEHGKTDELRLLFRFPLKGQVESTRKRTLMQPNVAVHGYGLACVFTYMHLLVHGFDKRQEPGDAHDEKQYKDRQCNRCSR